VLLMAVGLPIEFVLTWAFELTPGGIRRAETVTGATAAKSAHRAWIYVVMVACILSIGVFFLGRYTALRTSSSPESAKATAPSSKSVAVLPFANLSRDPYNAYFVAGIQDEIITQL